MALSMPTVEELYRNYGILADATEQVGQVGPRGSRRAGPRRRARTRDGNAASACSGARGPAARPSRGLPGPGGQPLRLSRTVDEMESFPHEMEIVGSGGRSWERSRKSRMQGLCKAWARPNCPDLDRNSRRRRSFRAPFCACRAPSCGGRWRRGRGFALSLAISDARGKDTRFVSFPVEEFCEESHRERQWGGERFSPKSNVLGSALRSLGPGRSFLKAVEFFFQALTPCLEPELEGHVRVLWGKNSVWPGGFRNPCFQCLLRCFGDVSVCTSHSTERETSLS